MQDTVRVLHYEIYLSPKTKAVLKATWAECALCSCLANKAAVRKLIYHFVFPIVGSKCFHRNPESHTHKDIDGHRQQQLEGLTTGAVGAPPSRLTLAGVGGHAAAMNTALCTESCVRKRHKKCGKGHRDQ